MKFKLVAAFVASTSAFAWTPAMAQDAVPQADTATTGEEGEIIVTATRRSEALSDVPIAVSAVSGETLAKSGATDVRALNQVAPSLLVSGATSEVNFSARIRGIGTVGENAGLESSVGLFIDGVYRSRTGVGLTELGDIERVEVLRGPQGTLFGRNSTAGLINIVTKGPDLSGLMVKGSASYGNYDYWRLDGAVNAPLSDTVAARLDGVVMKRDGFIKQITPGEPAINDRDRWLLRGQLLFQPNDDMKLRLIGDYGVHKENCCGGVLLSPVRNLSRGTDGFPVASANTLLPLLQAFGANYQVPQGTDPYQRVAATTKGVPYRSDSKDWGLSGELSWKLGEVNLTAISAYRDYLNEQGQDADFQAMDILRRTDLDRHFRIFTQELRLQGEALDGRVNWLVGGYYANEKLSVDDDIKYGADYERYANCLAATALSAANVNPASATCSNLPTTSWPGFQGLATLTGAARLNGTGNNGSTFNQKSENYAFFTHNTFDIVENKLKLTLGARYTHETKDLTAQANFTNTLCPAILATPFQALASIACVINGAGSSFGQGATGTHFGEGQWTGTAVLSWKPSNDVLVYGSASKGYKAGGFNLDFSALDRPCSTTGGSAAQNAACTSLLARPAFTPGNARAEATDLQFASEKVDAFEVGMKYNGRGFDLNVAAFYQRYSNYQLNTFNGVNFEVTNIQACKDGLAGADIDGSSLTGACASDRLKPGVTSKGFEVEAFLRPARNFGVNLGLTYADTKYASDLVGTSGRALSAVLFQLPGRAVSNAPQYVVTAGVSWTPELGSTGLTGLVYLDTRLQSDTNTGSDLDLEKIQDAYALFNGRIGVYGPGKRWGVELWGQNLLNKKYQMIGADMPLQGSGTFRAVASAASTGLAGTANQLFVGFPGEPRTYGATIKFTY
ncbi:TonB-dependent receptor [Novosphingobium sp. B 225]|uniref:TonB-dependent receptor n=1 Tax=Novosphingobium sp. B 225 TaxID=1961849 RepID=UPI000B4A8029|nr:TonB-dependent receptor [Novosphingobium sp. B 225]